MRLPQAPSDRSDAAQPILLCKKKVVAIMNLPFTHPCIIRYNRMAVWPPTFRWLATKMVDQKSSHKFSTVLLDVWVEQTPDHNMTCSEHPREWLEGDKQICTDKSTPQ